MITIKTDRLTIRESSGRDFSRIYAMLLSGRRKAGESLDLSGSCAGPGTDRPGSGSQGASYSRDTSDSQDASYSRDTFGSQDASYSRDTSCSQEDSAGSEFMILDVSEEEDEELEKYLAYIHTVYSVFGFGLWSVVLKKTGEVIGWCGLQPIGNEDTPLGRIELGYLIDREHRRSGYGYEACRAILDFGFEKLELDEVYAQIDERNRASLRMARKLGFTRQEGGLWAVVRSKRGFCE